MMRRGTSSAVLLLLVAGWVLLIAAPASARPTDYAITAPQAEAVLDKHVEITAYVDRTEPPPPEAPGPVEQVDLVTRLLDAEGKVIGKERTLTLVDTVDTGPGAERLRFRGVLNPSALGWTDQPVVAPNGQYTLQAQWWLRYGDDYSERAEEWKSVPLTFNVPPPATAAVAGVKDANAKQIEVAWRPIELPDLVGYRLEVSAGGTDWAIAQDDIGPDISTAISTVDDYGTYRYRVVTRRLAADGTELESVSEPTDPVELTQQASEQPVDDGVDDGDGNDGDGDGGTGNGGGPGTGPATSTPPPLAPQPLPQVSATPLPQAPPGANTQFDPLIDYGVDVTGERTERVAIDVPEAPGLGDGGVLSVDSGEGGPSQRVLSAVAGGLVLLLAAGHVIRFLNA